MCNHDVAYMELFKIDLEIKQVRDDSNLYSNYDGYKLSSKVSKLTTYKEKMQDVIVTKAREFCVHGARAHDVRLALKIDPLSCH